LNKLFRAPAAYALLLATLASNQHCSSAEQNKTNAATVVCLGDSITHAGYPEELGKMVPIHVINAGVPGNTSRQGLARLERDVLKHKPDAVVILFGTNDNRQDAPKVHVSLEEYEKNLGAMIDRCQGAGAKVILATIPPIDPEPYFARHDKAKFEAAGGLDKLVSLYRDAAVRVGKSKSTPVVDLNHLLAANKSWQRPDGVHPTPEGNRTIARLFLPELKAALGLRATTP
jgi:lysophospholipase L1-like esterase